MSDLGPHKEWVWPPSSKVLLHSNDFICRASADITSGFLPGLCDVTKRCCHPTPPHPVSPAGPRREDRWEAPFHSFLSPPMGTTRKGQRANELTTTTFTHPQQSLAHLRLHKRLINYICYGVPAAEDSLLFLCLWLVLCTADCIFLSPQEK